MKRLNKDERTGATALVLVALVVCFGSIFFSRRSSVEPAPEDLVKTIIIASDSMAKERDFSEKDDYVRKNKREKTKGKKNSKKGKKGDSKEKEGRKKKSGSTPPRDFLNDPV